jgi:hypothetical protein
MNEKEELELEVRRILASEVEGHRTFLQAQFRNLTWAIGILFTVGAIIFTFLFGKSIDESKDQLISTIDAKVVDYRIVESFKKKLEEYINIAVDKAVVDDATKKKIDTQISESTKSAVAKVETDIEDKLISTVTQEVSRSQSLNAQQLIEKVTMPRSAVLAFNRKSCPPGWEEYTKAYGRFVRGIDKSGSGIDPDGAREPGNTQDESFMAHSHSRPRGVYDAGGGSDAAWVAHDHYFGYGHKNPPGTGKAGGSETRPDNVALLYCEKT